VLSEINDLLAKLKQTAVAMFNGAAVLSKPVKEDTEDFVSIN